MSKAKRRNRKSMFADFEEQIAENRTRCVAIAVSTNERCKKPSKPGSKYCPLHRPTVPTIDWKDGVLIIGGVKVYIELLQEIYQIAEAALTLFSDVMNSLSPSDMNSSRMVGVDVSDERAHERIRDGIEELNRIYREGTAMETDFAESLVEKLVEIAERARSPRQTE